MVQKGLRVISIFLEVSPPLQLMDAAIGGMHSWGVGLSLYLVAVSLSKLAAEIAKGLVFRSIHEHYRWNSITVKKKR